MSPMHLEKAAEVIQSVLGAGHETDDVRCRTSHPTARKHRRTQGREKRTKTGIGIMSWAKQAGIMS